MLALASAFSAQAQQVPKSGDIEVLFLYLNAVHREANDVSSGTVNIEAGADRLHLKVSELSLFAQQYTALSATLATNTLDAKAYIDGAIQRREKPQQLKLDQLYAQRIAVLRATQEELRRRVGDARWTEIYAFLDGEYRKRLSVFVSALPKGVTQ